MENYDEDDFSNFCKSTKMYGFSHLNERTPRIEKLYWCFFIVLSICLSTTVIVQKWSQWTGSPIVVSTTSRPIWEVPFPAITICSETKIRQFLYNYTDVYHQVMNKNVTPEELRTFSDASLLCDNAVANSDNKTTTYENVMNFIRQYSPSLDTLLFACKWSHEARLCRKFFTQVVTDDGLCFTFNMLAQQDILTSGTSFEHYKVETPIRGWSPHGYTTKSIEDSFPRRTPTSGLQRGFFVVLADYQQHLDYICRGPLQGFRVHLHQPSDFPRFRSHYFRVPLNQEVIVAVEPHLQTVSEDMRSYEPSKRGCFFTDERQLKFFKHYSQTHCQLECLANFTLSRCGCVGFNMPHEEENRKICAAVNRKCISDAEDELLIREAESEGCNCLPGCTSLSYRVETSQADFHWNKLMESFKTDHTVLYPGIQMARLTIFFKNMQFDSSERSTSGNFLAHCGGVLAFFCGFSFLTLAEIVYFLSIRIASYVKRIWG